jgi:ParB/RepB/Spo0J family partition protein
MSVGSYEVITVEQLVRHPENRVVKQSGEKWETLCASMREHGQLQPLLVRDLAPYQYEIIAGERRWLAAQAVGLLEMACIVREFSDKEALEIVLIENLEREDLDAVEEARGVRALIEKVGMAPGEVAARLKRSLEWVTTRQGLLDFPEEVLTAVSRPLSDERHLGLGTVQLILGLPVEDRPRAVQLVLHPQFQPNPLTKAQAADVIRRQIVQPKAERAEWEAGREKRLKAWKARLRRLLPKKMQEDLVLRVASWEEAQAQAVTGRDAEEALPLAEVMPNAPQPLFWVHLAVRHGLTVMVVPADNEEQSRAVVDARVLRHAELPLHEVQKRKIGEEGGEAVWEEAPSREPWLALRGKAAVVVETSKSPAPAEEQLRRAQAAVEGEPEHPEMTDEGATAARSVVLETASLVQPWTIDGGPVTALRMWAEREMKNQAAQKGEIKRPDFKLPPWASWLPLPQVVEVMSWVEGLKR